MGGRKSPFRITLAIALYNSLYYRRSRDINYLRFLVNMLHLIIPSIITQQEQDMIYISQNRIHPQEIYQI